MKQLLRDARTAALVRTHQGRGPASGIPLPPRPFRMGGKHFQDDRDFIAGALADTDRLVTLAGLNNRSTLLDWGCGAGRLAIGIAERLGRIDRYHGVDVQRHLIEWAGRHIGRRPGYDFTFVNTRNERYNATGTSDTRLPAADDSYDVIYAYSVYSHMRTADVRAYLGEFRRTLRPDGLAFFTAFVEKDVEREAVDPAGYGPLSWSGHLHCVRYDLEFFDSLLDEAGLAVRDFTHGTETDGQSMYLVGRSG